MWPVALSSGLWPFQVAWQHLDVAHGTLKKSFNTKKIIIERAWLAY